MSYATGNGPSYVEFMAAVLAFALANGWTAVNGDGNWPITNGQSLGSVAWTTETLAANDVTAGSPKAGPHTLRMVSLHIGPGAAPDMTKKSRLANMEFPLTWFLFCDNTIGKHIHAVVRFDNGINPDCYSHMSFGDIDKEGMTHGGIGYSSAHLSRGIALNGSGIEANGSVSGDDWNSLHAGNFPFSGRVGDVVADQGWVESETSWFVNPSNAPFPVGNGWPNYGEVYPNGTRLWKTSRFASWGHLPDQRSQNNSWWSSTSAGWDVSINWISWHAKPHPFSGVNTFMPIPVFPMTGGGSGSRMMMVGSFPNVRTCSMETYTPEEEIVFGGETWKLFPLLRKTANSVLCTKFAVTSGLAGFAYKKVA